MEKFNCVECKNNFDKSEVRSKFKPAFQWNRYSLSCYSFWEYRCIKCLGKHRIKNSAGGFIQIPLLITIIVGILILGGGGYLGFKKYQSYQEQQVAQKAAEDATTQQKIADQAQQTQQQIDALQQEVTTLKNKSTPPPSVSSPKPPMQPSTPATVPSTQQTQSLSTIISQWRPYVVNIQCSETYQGQLLEAWGGSGLAAGFNSSFPNEFTILTNKHVLAVPIPANAPVNGTFAPDFCKITFPDGHTINLPSPRISDNPTQDIAIVRINNPDQYLLSFPKVPTYCSKRPAVGKSLVVLGYPAIGSQTDITATEGIVSGFDGIYDITSAKIEHGNSGGVAIATQENCFMGIPSFVDVGTIESLGRILDLFALSQLY